ncbi:MAG: enolase C-terminal domain-like protein [Acidimicrobiia bacterium]
MSRISAIRSILTAPAGIALVIVRVETDDGVHGLGCATFTQRPTLVAQAVDEYLAPLLVGRDPARIEDLWHLMYVNAYWRNGPVLNNAISGVDMALWDIKGKQAGMPVHDLLGGRSRNAAMVYRHAEGRDPHEVLESVERHRAEGAMAVRCQLGGYGGSRSPVDGPSELRVELPGAYYSPDAYARGVRELFDVVRGAVGDELHLLHDVHERLAPIDAIRLAVDLEPHRLFFLEDPFPPDQVGWFRRLRERTTTPIAMGELHNHPLEWQGLVTERLVDFVRAHISQLGGITPARKLAALGEAFGVRTAWHGPGDTSPVGHAANLHLDLVAHNFGIQEVIGFPEPLHEVFSGIPELRDGHLWPNGLPGLGIDIDEAAAARYPIELAPIGWTQSRWPDGTLWTP